MAQKHFLLFCNTHLPENSVPVEAQSPALGGRLGRWHFVLECLNGAERLEVADSESVVAADRLALLCVVRGLEALEQPSQVTLVTTSRYVTRGLRYGLSSWRETNYTWERFGVQKPVRNADLWQRVERAMQFHGVTCRLIESALHSATQLESRKIAGGGSRRARQITQLPEQGSEVACTEEVAELRPKTGIPAVPTGDRSGSWQFATTLSRIWRGRKPPRIAFYGA